VVAGVLGSFSAKLGDETNDQTSAILPEDSQAAAVSRIQNERFATGEVRLAVVVYRRDGGLTKADEERVLADARAIGKLDGVISVETPTGPLSAVIPPFGRNAGFGLVSPDRAVAFTVVPISAEDPKQLLESVEDIRDHTGEGNGGIEIRTTGDAALQADFSGVFETADVRLLVVTGLLVLLLLLGVYRSLVIALVPLLVVGISYAVASGILYLAARAGMQVDSTSTSILLVLMFGAGTDYCLLVVARYSDDLRRTEDHHEALRSAARRAGPAVLASGVTVMAALLVLLLADLSSTRTLGPVNAIGIAVLLIATFTLLPALLAIFGRRGFWPSQRQVAYRGVAAPQALLPGLGALPAGLAAAPTDEHPSVRTREGIWRGVGRRVLRRPATVLAGALGVLVLGTVGWTVYEESPSPAIAFVRDTDATEGYELLRSGFPEGVLGPTTVTIERPTGPVLEQDISAVQAELQGVLGIIEVDQAANRSVDGRVAAFTLYFNDDPYEQAAFDRVEQVREVGARFAPELEVLVGDSTAINLDYTEAAQRDNRVLVPLILLVILIVLVILLRAVVAPLYLIVTTVISYLGILGASLLAFRYLFGESEGFDPVLPMFVFIFLIALGVDYNIFLMSRVREEALRHGMKQGVLRALSATGPVITSAGLILAGTFAVLMTLNVNVLFQLGFAVSIGVLIDTFLVRTLIVPAIAILVGEPSWWPSRSQQAAPLVSGVYRVPSPLQAASAEAAARESQSQR
jgi:RND superfamily putative drug exporter